MVFFDSIVKFRLRDDELDRASKVVKKDSDLESLSHLMRVALLRELDRRETKKVSKHELLWVKSTF